MIFDDDDLTAFFDEDFAEPAFVGTNEIKVIFDKSQEIVNEYNVIGYKSVAEVKNSDIDNLDIAEDTEIEIRNVAYKVSYIQDLGFATSKAFLEKQ